MIDKEHDFKFEVSFTADWAGHFKTHWKQDKRRRDNVTASAIIMILSMSIEYSKHSAVGVTDHWSMK